MVEGEILIAEGKIDSGIEQLRAAIQKEDALKYDEPPGWLIPVRHSLGAVLMKQQRFAEAEQVYRDDLARLPENGWSLLGLAESLRKQKKNPDEVAQTQSKFRKSLGKSRSDDYHFVSLPAAGMTLGRDAAKCGDELVGLAVLCEPSRSGCGPHWSAVPT